MAQGRYVHDSHSHPFQASHITNTIPHPPTVMTEEDTHLAVQHGVDGIIVSNHGGRQLDGATSTLDALPECVAAAQGQVPVHFDGGIRRGSDIFKALALGASGVWLGRIPIWGLAVSENNTTTSLPSYPPNKSVDNIYISKCSKTNLPQNTSTTENKAYLSHSESCTRNLSCVWASRGAGPSTRSRKAIWPSSGSMGGYQSCEPCTCDLFISVLFYIQCTSSIYTRYQPSWNQVK